MAHCFVTGASGFIGTHLVERLRADGHDVTALVQPGDSADTLVTNGARIAQGDITDPAVVRAAVDNAGLTGGDVAYHLAGLTREFSYSRFAAVNVAGTENVARALAKCSSPPTLLHVSSIAAGGPAEPCQRHAESDADQPRSNYGRSKLAGEQALQSFADRLPISIARPAIVFGPGDADNLTIFRMIRRTGVHFVYRRHEFPMSLVYVDDLVAAMITIANRGERLQCSPPPSAGEGLGEGARRGIYNVADPQVSSYAELGQLAAAAMNRRPPVIRIRHGWLYPPAICGDLLGRILRRPLILNIDKLRDALAPSWAVSTERIQQIGFQPAAPLAKRFQQTAQWYRENNWL